MCFQEEALEICTAVFHNKENEIAIDRNGDIRSLFPWTSCERLLEFTSESVHKRVAGCDFTNIH